MGGAGGEIDAGIDAPVCIREADTVFCSRQRKNCGAFNALDNCGMPYTTNCGICVDLSVCGGGGTLNVCSGTGPINRAQGGTITASLATDVKATEDRAKAFDNNVNTKWFVSATRTPWIAYQFPGGATYAINLYTVTSANDMPGRDPKDWRLEGSNDLVSWTVLDTRTNEVFASRFQTNTYSFTNTTAYGAYRFFVTANSGATQCQFAELQLFDVRAPTPDAGPPDASEAGAIDAGVDQGSDGGADAGSSGDGSSEGGSGDGVSTEAGTFDDVTAPDAAD
jgi:hypothetical protein